MQHMILYIDPGTGSMLFTILLGIIGALAYSLRVAWVKVRFLLTGGKSKEATEEVAPYVIFSDHKRYWNVFEPVCREMDKRGLEVRYLTFSEDDPAFECGLSHIKPEYIGNDNKAFAKLNFLKADIVLSTTPGLEVYQWKRSKNVKFYVHTLHAFGQVLGYRSFGMDYFDAVFVSGEHERDTIRELEKLRNLPAKELPMGGVPYMDEMVKRYQLCKEDDSLKHSDTKTVLLAPSWGKSSILSKYGGRFIKELLKTGYHVIIRPHPQSFASEKEMIDALMTEFPDNEQLEWNRDVDNFEVLKRSDILISDYSGVIFDFSLIFNRPIIYADTDFDSSPYDAWWLKRGFWTVSILDKIGKKLNPEDIDKIKDVIDSCIESEAYKEGRQWVIEQSWQEYGNGAVATVDYLEKKRNELVGQTNPIK